MNEADRWNHNIAYHSMILRSLPERVALGLDVGCGEGTLARRLRARVDHLVGIDLDEPSIVLARQHPESQDIDFHLGDFLGHPFEPASFDVIVSVATLHHMDTGVGLERMAKLLRPGGRLVVVGLARTRQPVDVVFDLLGAVATRRGCPEFRRTSAAAP